MNNIRIRALACACLLSVALISCGDGDATSETAPKEPPTRSASGSDAKGRIFVTLERSTPQPKAGSTTNLRLSASAVKAHGDFRYEVQFGDPGKPKTWSGEEGCVEGRGSINRRIWPLPHEYRKPGLYHVRATIYVDCDRYRATTNLLMRVRP